MDVQEFRRLGHELIDWIADYREKACRGDFPVQRNPAPGTVKRALPKSPPVESEGFDLCARTRDISWCYAWGAAKRRKTTRCVCIQSES
jgi:hypothetical protein